MATKRQSNWNLPVGKVKRQKNIKDTKADWDSIEPERPNHQLFSAEQSVSKHAREDQPKSRDSPLASYDDDEYQEDQGRMESQQFLALVALESKRKKNKAKAAGDFIEKFKKSVHVEEQALKKHMEEFETASTAKDAEFLERFTAAFKASCPSLSPTNELAQKKRPLTDVPFSILLPQTQSLIANARAILSRFDSASEQTSKIIPWTSYNKEWEAENQDVTQLVTIGQKLGVQKLEALLRGDPVPQVVDEGDKKSMHTIFGKETTTDVSWGALAKKQLKAARKLHKTTTMAEPSV